MTKTRAYDVYFKINENWKFQWRTFFPLSKNEQLKRGNIAKNLPCRQAFYSGWDSRVWFKKAANEGFTGAYFLFIMRRLLGDDRQDEVK